MAADPSRQFRLKTAAGQTKEPVSEARVMDLIRKGRLQPQDLIQRVGSNKWRRLGEMAPAIFEERTQAVDPIEIADPKPPARLRGDVRHPRRPEQPPIELAVSSESPNDWLSTVGSVTEGASDFIERDLDPDDAAELGAAVTDQIGINLDADELKQAAPALGVLRSGLVSLKEAPAADLPRTLHRFRAAALIFSGLVSLEAFKAGKFFLTTTPGDAFAGNWYHGHPTLVDIPYSLLTTFGDVAATEATRFLLQPMMIFSAIAGGFVTGKLISALPVEERPTTVGRSWLLWCSPILLLFAVLLLCAPLPESMTGLGIGAIVMACAIAALMAHAWMLLRVHLAVNRRLKSAGFSKVSFVGLLGILGLMIGIATRAVGVGAAGFMALKGGEQAISDTFELVLGIALLIAPIAIAGCFLMIAEWGMELAVKIPRSGAAFTVKLRRRHSG